jgi:WD40 repeat protein
MIIWQPGQLINKGRFTIEQVLGMGGFGITYKAEDTRSGEIFAIKTLNPTMQLRGDFPEQQVKFINEAVTIRGFNHPHVLKVYEVIQEGQLFGVVMEYIDGVSLSEYVETNGQLTETTALTYINQIGQALSYIHQQNYLHRDVKPHNILLRNNQKEAVLIDFGLARIMATQKSMSNSLTQGYAPIEQYQRNGNFGPHTDVYALAATLYYLLTADELRNQGEISPVSALNRKYEGETLPAPNSYNPRISQRVNDAILKGMALEPEERTRDTLEFRKSLGLVAPPPTQPEQPQPSEPKKPLPRKYPSTGIDINTTVQLNHPTGTPHRCNPWGGIDINTTAQLNHPHRVKILLATSAIVGLMTTQIYAYMRYGLFPTNPISVITGSPLNNLTGQLENTLTGHSNWVLSVGFSPDGQTLASGSRDNTIKLWDVNTGKELQTLTGHSNLVLSVGFSPDGQTLASGGVDQTIKLWDVQTGKELRTLTGHSHYVNSVGFSPDGQTLASGSYDKTIKLWDVQTGKVRHTLTGHSNWVFSVGFSPDSLRGAAIGQTLASGGVDQTIKLWDVQTGKELRTLTGHSHSVNSVGFSPDGQTLASGSRDNTIKLWDVNTGKELQTLTGHSNLVLSVGFSPDGYTLASGSGDNTIKLWDVRTGNLRHTLTGHSYFVRSVGFSPDGQTLASGSNDNTIKLWRLR